MNSPLKSEIGAAFAELRGWWIGLGVFSGVINILTLTGSIFMLQVYDRVLTSRSVPTLIALLIIAVGLYSAQGLLEIVRSRLLMRIGTRFEEIVGRRIHGMVQLWPLRQPVGGDGLQPLRDLDTLKGFLSENASVAILDLPWMPVFLLFVFFLHPWLGFLTLAGAVILGTLALATEYLSRAPVQAAVHANIKRQALSHAGRRNAEVLRAMGFAERFTERWVMTSHEARLSQQRAGDITGSLSAIARAVRTALQAGSLSLGAWLVIRGEVSAGVIIAGSITSARALAPIDQAIGQWRMVTAARDARRRLEGALKKLPPEPTNLMPMPAPCQTLVLENISARSPTSTTPIVQNVSLRLAAGQGLGVIGQSAAGKSSLVRAIVGVWPVTQGSVRLDGARLQQWEQRRLGRHIGYLPQDIELFSGTVAENIARFDEHPDPDKVIAAAKASGVHDLIQNLPKGYDSVLGDDGAGLSGGQRQRIGLARALYGDPFIVVLDEPNSNLDETGENALVQAILHVRKRGGIVIVVAHRPKVLEALDVLALMERGTLKSFGPKDEVMQKFREAAAAKRAGPPQGTGQIAAQPQAHPPHPSYGPAPTHPPQTPQQPALQPAASQPAAPQPAQTPPQQHPSPAPSQQTPPASHPAVYAQAPDPGRSPAAEFAQAQPQPSFPSPTAAAGEVVELHPARDSATPHVTHGPAQSVSPQLRQSPESPEDASPAPQLPTDTPDAGGDTPPKPPQPTPDGTPPARRDPIVVATGAPMSNGRLVNEPAE